IEDRGSSIENQVSQIQFFPSSILYPRSSSLMNDKDYKPSLHRVAMLTAVATFPLIFMGGLVTSHGAGMAVPDWPNSYGYNMFLFPVSKWIGGILYEHTHRLMATFVGVLVVALTRWLGGNKSRILLIVIGLAEIAGGFAFLLL